MEALGGIIGDAALFLAIRHAVDKEFHLGFVRIYQHLFLFALIAPADRPGMSIDMQHRFFRPITLKHIIALLRCAIALANALLIYIGYRVIGAQGGTKVLKSPESRPRQVGHLRLFFQMPVK